MVSITSKNTLPEDSIFKHISSSHMEALIYMDGRRKGTIKSIKTPWPIVNEMLSGGLEWNTINIIGGRPGSGKTLAVNNITRSAFDINTDQTFAVLDFQLEMLGRNSSLRLLSSYMGMSMAELKSSKSPVTVEQMVKARDFFNLKKDLPIYEIEKPVTVEGFKKIIRRFYAKFGVPFIVTLDHSILLKKAASERDTLDMLYNLGEALTELKKELPVLFIILSQLNREAESKERLEPYKASNYPNSSDIFGGDALFQHADNVLILDRPTKRNLTNYGPHKWIVDDHKYIACHLLKARDGEPCMWWMNGDFANMRILELNKSDYPKMGSSFKSKLSD